MNFWQVNMAIWLAGNVAAIFVGWWITWRRYRWMAMPPRQRLMVKHSYLLALLPLAEAWILYMGDFWS